MIAEKIETEIVCLVAAYGPRNLALFRAEGWIGNGLPMALAIESDKVMFEIYRELEFGRRYRVVYFTELDEHNRELEINEAMRGEHVFDGYLRNYTKQEGKRTVAGIIERLNAGESLGADQIELELKPYIA